MSAEALIVSAVGVEVRKSKSFSSMAEALVNRDFVSFNKYISAYKAQSWRRLLSSVKVGNMPVIYWFLARMGGRACPKGSFPVSQPILVDKKEYGDPVDKANVIAQFLITEAAPPGVLSKAAPLTPTYLLAASLTLELRNL